MKNMKEEAFFYGNVKIIRIKEKNYKNYWYIEMYTIISSFI